MESACANVYCSRVYPSPCIHTGTFKHYKGTPTTSGICDIFFGIHAFLSEHRGGEFAELGTRIYIDDFEELVDSVRHCAGSQAEGDRQLREVIDAIRLLLPYFDVGSRCSGKACFQLMELFSNMNGNTHAVSHGKNSKGPRRHVRRNMQTEFIGTTLLKQGAPNTHRQLTPEHVVQVIQYYQLYMRYHLDARTNHLANWNHHFNSGANVQPGGGPVLTGQSYSRINVLYRDLDAKVKRINYKWRALRPDMNHVHDLSLNMGFNGCHWDLRHFGMTNASGLLSKLDD